MTTVTIDIPDQQAAALSVKAAACGLTLDDSRLRELAPLSMAALVVDASVALAWALPDEISAYADAVLVAVETEGLRVPELWPREVANGLAIACIRKRLTPGAERQFVAALSRLTISVDQSANALAVIVEGTSAAARFGLPLTTQPTSS